MNIMARGLAFRCSFSRSFWCLRLRIWSASRRRFFRRAFCAGCSGSAGSGPVELLPRAGCGPRAGVWKPLSALHQSILIPRASVNVAWPPCATAHGNGNFTGANTAVNTKGSRRRKRIYGNIDILMLVRAMSSTLL